MKKVELPVQQPLMSTFVTYASRSIILSTNPSANNFFYNHTIQLECKGNLFKGYSSPIPKLKSERFTDMNEIAESVDFPIRFVRHCPNEIIKASLDAGYYFYLRDADDYYIPGKSWYRKRHFWHHGLISGYDDNDNTFTMNAYDDRWLFSTFKVPQICIPEAIETICAFGRMQEKQTAAKGKNCTFELDLPLIQESLCEYLTYVPIVESAGDDFVRPCGVAVYDYLKLFLELLLSERIPHERFDWRVFRLIWEHKKVMLDRIAAIEDHMHTDHSLSEAYKPVEMLANKIRLMYAKYHQKPEQSILQYLIVALAELREKEVAVLTEFVKKLDDYLMKEGDYNAEC